MACQFFICYAMEEDRDQAEAIRALLDHPGVTCWMAPGSIPPGESYARAIPRGIRTSDVVVVVFSKAADESEDVSIEIQLARTHKKRIVPVRIADHKPDHLEYFLSLPNWVELHGTHRASGERALRELALEVRGPLSAPLPAPPAEAAEPTPSPKPAPAVPVRSRRVKDPEAEIERLQKQIDQQRALADKREAEMAQRTWERAAACCRRKTPDFQLARELFESAALHGKQDGKAERQLYEQGAAAGNIAAIVSLGLLLESGERVPEDVARAKKLYERAAESGDAEAMCRLGVMANNGVPRGTPNYGVAQRWFRQAAGLGHAGAMRAMGDWFAAKNDRQNAQMWYDKADTQQRAGITKKGGSKRQKS